jgi:mRNA interferase RelE/StbE
MGRYRLVVRASVAKDLRGIPKKDVSRILDSLKSLSEEPRPPGIQKLSGQERYRIRLGAYRILYEIDDTDTCVVAVKVGHRKDVYRNR